VRREVRARGREAAAAAAAAAAARHELGEGQAAAAQAAAAAVHTEATVGRASVAGASGARAQARPALEGRGECPRVSTLSRAFKVRRSFHVVQVVEQSGRFASSSLSQSRR